MSDWIALSDRADLNPAAPEALDRGLFVLEYRLPILEPTVLLQFQAEAPFARGFSVFFDPASGISILHRQGATLRRHRLAGPIHQKLGMGRLTFAFDAGVPQWRLTHAVLGEAAGEAQAVQGNLALPVLTADMHALAVDGRGCRRHPAVLWFGLTRAQSLPARAPWIGLNTPVDTKRGPVRAGLLRPGDMIATLEGGYQPLRAVHRQSFPSRGSFAPVVLRSPFFGETTDILVSADQLVLISGASVEYLFGVEEALIPAGALCDDRVAVKDDRRALTDAVTLDLGAPQAITADGCCLISAYADEARLPRRALKEFEALPLLSLLGRTSLRYVA